MPQGVFSKYQIYPAADLPGRSRRLYFLFLKYCDVRRNFAPGLIAHRSISMAVVNQF